MLGNLNCRVGRAENDKVVGKYGEEIAEICREHEYVIANIFFEHKNIHKYTL